VRPGRQLPTVKRYLHTALEQAAVRRPPGYIEEVRAAAVEITGKWVVLTDEAHDALFRKFSPLYLDPGFGPGTELKKLLGAVGLVADENCQCNKRAKIMNIWGCDECERRTEEIVGWLREEATKRGLPFFDAAGRLVVRRAIAAARRSAAVDAADTVATGGRHGEASASGSLTSILHGE